MNHAFLTFAGAIPKFGCDVARASDTAYGVAKLGASAAQRRLCEVLQLLEVVPRLGRDHLLSKRMVVACVLDFVKPAT